MKSSKKILSQLEKLEPLDLSKRHTVSEIVDGNGKPTEQRAKAMEIWVVKDSSGNNTVEIIGKQPNKAMMIEILCEALKIAASLEFQKQKPIIESPGMMRFFRK